MSAQIKFQNHAPKELNGTRNKVEVTVLLSRLNTERKIEKKRNLALGVAAVSAISVFTIILTL